MIAFLIDILRAFAFTSLLQRALILVPSLPDGRVSSGRRLKATLSLQAPGFLFMHLSPRLWLS